MIPFKRKGTLYSITNTCNYIELGCNVTWAGEDCSKCEYNALLTAGSLFSGWFILNNKSTKPHYKHTHFITHTKKSPSPGTLLQRMKTVCAIKVCTIHKMRV